MTKKKKVKKVKKSNKVLNQIISNYKKAVKQVEELETRGFVFKESFKKNLFNRIVNMKKPNAKTRDFYKKMGYKKELYKQAKAFEEEPNKFVSVKQGKRIVRARNKESRKIPDPNAEEIREALSRYEGGVTCSVRGGKGRTEVISLDDEIKEINEILDEMESRGERVSDSVRADVVNDINKIEYRYADEGFEYLDLVKAKLSGGTTESLVYDIELTGTPFEGKQ